MLNQAREEFYAMCDQRKVARMLNEDEFFPRLFHEVEILHGY